MSQSRSDKSPTKRPTKTQHLELSVEDGVEELLATVEEQLDKLDERLVKLLAWQRLQQVRYFLLNLFSLFFIHFLYLFFIKA